MLLKNCRLIPELSGMLDIPLADVELEGGKIKSIAHADPASTAPDAVDCQGRTLLPGLFDLHAHCSLARADETPLDGMNKLVQAMGWLTAYTDWGITTIRDCGSTLRLAIPLRDAVRSGAVPGPRIIASGYILAPQSMYQMGRRMMMAMDIANSVDEFRFAARNQLALGADFIKVYASQSGSQSTEGDPRPIVRIEELKAVVEIAEMAGTYVAAHAHSLAAIKQCVEAGVQTIEHATFIDAETIERLEVCPNVCLTPTFAVLVPPESEETGGKESPRKGRMLGIAAEGIAAAYRAGVKLGFGSDLYNGNLAGFYHEFKVRSELCGMKNIDILLQATRYSAEIAGLGGITGEVREDLAADLILVAGNPDENIAVMYQKPVMVFQNGTRLR